MAIRPSLITMLWHKQRYFLLTPVVLAVLCVIVVIIHLSFCAPRLNSLHSAQHKVQTQLRQLELSAANRSSTTLARQPDTDLQQLYRRIPLHKDFSFFLGDLFGLAEQAGLTIHQISFRQEPDKDMSLLHYGLNFSVIGNYEQLKKFLYLLEQSPRILLIEKISFVGVQKGQDINLKLQLSTFFQERPA